ncbi:MAG TPA: serpin family protein [Candidatus Limnocylindrales bacterium]|nr:serpin family protein [Candidatus Limnocylindrales bacterium]
MRRLTAVLASVILVAACAGGTSPSPSPTQAPTATPGDTAAPAPSPTEPSASTIELARSDVARLAGDPARAAAAAAALNAFGLDVYGRLAAAPGNVVVSPASIAIALSMARAGARGATAAEMDAVLRNLGAEDLADAASALDAALAARTGTFEDAAGDAHEVTLRIANALFAQRDMALVSAFLDAMAARYGAGIWTVDFMTDPEAARVAINAWVAEQTEDRIEEILKPGQITAATRLAIANAIYLKAPWFYPFDEDETVGGTFTAMDGSTVQAPFMHLVSTHVSGAKGSGWVAVELPYVGRSLAMTLILPDDLGAFESTFDAAAFGAITGALQPAQVDLRMPAFDTESRVELSSLLAALGMPTAFDAAADFSGMTTEEKLHIGFVIHQANITVDEAGTEAAAATVVGMDTSGGGPTLEIDLTLDHPFLFVLRDVPTGAIVFMGRVDDPGTTP